MPHGIILGKLETLKGNATSGMAHELWTSVTAAHDYLDGSPVNPEQVEAKLDEIETAVVQGSLTDGVVESFDVFKKDLNDLIGL